VYFADIVLPSKGEGNDLHKVAVKKPLSNGWHASDIAREIEIMELLDHSNIMRPIAKFKFKGYFGYVMEAIDGLDLDVLVRHLKNNGYVDELESLLGDVMIELVPALAYMHSMGVAHRDIKLTNVMVETKEESDGNYVLTPFICDFGVSISKLDSRKVHEVRGSPAFFPPEYVHLNEVTLEQAQAADVYALGMLIIQYVTGWTRPYLLYKIPGQVMAQLERFGGKELRSFVESLITHDPKFRPMMRNLFQHSWLIQQLQMRDMPLPKASENASTGI